MEGAPGDEQVHFGDRQFRQLGRCARLGKQAFGDGDGVLVAVTTSEARIFRPATSKGAHKTFDSYSCDSAAVVRFQDMGYVLAGLFGDGTLRAYTLPALKELNSINISNYMDPRRFPDSVIVPNGDVIGWTGPSEMAMISMWGTGQPL